MAMRSPRPSTSILAAALALAVAAAGCNRASVAPEPARPPSLSATGVPLCQLAPSQLRPLVVEWTGADRGSLELRLRRGLVAVRYEGCELEVLRDCVVPGAYTYAGFTRKRDTVTISTTDDLFGQLPVGATDRRARDLRSSTRAAEPQPGRARRARAAPVERRRPRDRRSLGHGRQLRARRCPVVPRRRDRVQAPAYGSRHPALAGHARGEPDPRRPRPDAALLKSNPIARARGP